MITGCWLTSSEVTGVAPTADWHRWIQSGNAPPADDGIGFASSWRDDLALLASLGVDEIAVTLEWARLWPTADRPDEGAVEHHRDLLTEIRGHGIAAWACLVDGSLPGWFADDERGFTDDRSRRLLWPRHVDWVGETFGDIVDGWITQREPVQWAAWGHLLGAVPPARQRRRDADRAVAAALDADVQAWRLLQGAAPVAISHTARRVVAEPDNVRARPHADWLDHTFHQRWLSHVSEGAASAAFDRVLAQVRPPVQIDDEGRWSEPAGVDPIEAAADAVARIETAIGDRPMVVAGDLADVAIDGENRPDHLRAMLEMASELAAGWWQTSPIDGWHWQRGRSVTPGVFDAERSERPEAQALRLVSSSEITSVATDRTEHQPDRQREPSEPSGPR